MRKCCLLFFFLVIFKNNGFKGFLSITNQPCRIIEIDFKGSSLLLEEVENDAKSKGAKLIHLDTFDFQAKEFYEKQGYIVFGILENCPEKHYRYYLKKVL